MIPLKDPIQRFTSEEVARMSEEEFCDLIDESNTYIQLKYKHLNENQKPLPKGKTDEEIMAYFNARPLDEVINEITSKKFF